MESSGGLSWSARLRNTSTAGNAIPSFTPLSTLRSRRNRSGTALLPTSEAENTGSVGLRTAPSSKASTHGSPTSQWAAPAASTIVRGIPNASARAGNRH